MTPRHAATAFSSYTIRDGWLRGWAVHAGVIWQDERVGGQSAPNATTNTDPLLLESFYRLDAGLGRRFSGGLFLVYTGVALSFRRFFPRPGRVAVQASAESDVPAQP